MSLDEPTRSRLLHVAREAILAELSGGSAQESEIHGSWPPLGRRGVFVTLRREGHLRGCVGTFHPTAELPLMVRIMAAAALHDDRFLDDPVTAAEAPDLQIEISVLTPLQRMANPLDFQIGVHGIFVRLGERGGCFLPEVAVAHEWDNETFLAQCCAHKAGLDPLAWQRPDAEVYTFTVDKVGSNP